MLGAGQLSLCLTLPLIVTQGQVDVGLQVLEEAIYNIEGKMNS
jgi:hypothetical protein